MRTVLRWVPVLALALASPAAASDPNIFGPTGVLRTPSADVLPFRAYNVFFYGADAFLTYGVNFGLTSALEVGGSIFDPDRGRSKGLINAKYRFTRDTLTTPAIAVGVQDLADSIDQSVYLAVSKGFGTVALGGRKGLGLRATAGFGTGFFDDTFFGSAELFFTDRLTLMGEYDGRDLNFGASFRLGQGVHVRGGLLDSDEFFAGITYAAGF